MRISLWPVLVCCWLLAACVGRSATAFEPGGAYGMPPAGGGNSNYGQGGYPATAWPNVSPYTEPDFEQVYNDGGVWRYDSNDDNVRSLFGLDFLITWGLRPGNQLIGSGDPPASNALFDSNDNYLGGGTNPNANQPVTGAVTNQGANYGLIRTNIFQNFTHYGVRARYGWLNSDDSGFLATGFYVAANQAVKIMHPDGSISDNPAIQATQAFARIPYNNGLQGVLALFDSLFTQYYDQEFWGADGDIIAAPFYRRQAFKLSVTYGVKYLHVSETFSFNALDSSTSGNFGPGETIIPPATGPFPDPLNTWVTSQVNSNLIGPSIGVKYDLGGEKFKLWGITKVAVAANIERMRVYGQNAYGNTDFLLLGNTSFDNTRDVTHISPILDTSIFGEFPLFSMIPIVNKITLLNQAQFRIGWNFILVGEMSRPANVIAYNFNDPTVRTSRTWFSLSTLSFGLDWKF